VNAAHKMPDAALPRAFALTATDFRLVLRGEDMLPCKLSSHE